MFTGIIQAIGTVRAVEERGGDARLVIDMAEIPAARLSLGASIAVNGACLTVAARESQLAKFDVSRESLSLTTLGALRPGARVNLEPALAAAEPLGGHLVSGHVDGIGEVLALASDARSTRMSVRVPAGVARYVARKGSLCVDGVSLTVNEVEGDRAGINLVPHTLQATIMAGYTVGTRVNIEIDLIARYLGRLLEARDGPPPTD